MTLQKAARDKRQSRDMGTLTSVSSVENRKGDAAADTEEAVSLSDSIPGFIFRLAI